MKTTIFNTKPFEKKYLDAANTDAQHEFVYIDAGLNEQTAILAAGSPVICCFVNDDLSEPVLTMLSRYGTELITLRSAGFNNVDLIAAEKLRLKIARVPKYSPYAVAEFAVALILTLNRHIIRAYTHVREHDFSLEGLMGFDLHGKTVGVIGTGNIGSVFCKIMLGFGCNVIAYDPVKNAECKKMGVKYVALEKLYEQSDIISLHCPLTEETQHMINADAISHMKKSVMLINTGRGALINTKDIIKALKKQKIGYLGLDVYEEEENLFFQDLSQEVIKDDMFARLQTFPNVLITGHQAFFTSEAMENIAATTVANITALTLSAPFA